MPDLQAIADACGMYPTKSGSGWIRFFGPKGDSEMLMLKNDGTLLAKDKAEQFKSDDSEIRQLSGELVTTYDELRQRMNGDIPTAPAQESVPQMQIVERKPDNSVREFEERDTAQILDAVKYGAILKEFFYTIPRGKRNITGISYAGAMQIKHNWDESNPENPICFSEAEEDELQKIVLKENYPNYICLKVIAWYKNNPEAKVTGRCAEPISKFQKSKTIEYAIKVVEHKAIRNAITALVEPEKKVEAQVQYKQYLETLVKDGVTKLPKPVAYKEIPAKIVPLKQNDFVKGQMLEHDLSSLKEEMDKSDDDKATLAKIRRFLVTNRKNCKPEYKYGAGKKVGDLAEKVLDLYTLEETDLDSFLEGLIDA